MEVFILILFFLLILIAFFPSIWKSIKKLLGYRDKYDYCHICNFEFSSDSERYFWKLEGVKQVVCSKCNRRLDQQVYNQKFKTFMNKLDSDSDSIATSANINRHISTKTKNIVWQRDHGRCVQCGSNQNLEFDHIIPVAKGGSNTARNIQLLCERCNRKKSDNI